MRMFDSLWARMNSLFSRLTLWAKHHLAPGNLLMFSKSSILKTGYSILRQVKIKFEIKTTT